MLHVLLDKEEFDNYNVRAVQRKIDGLYALLLILPA